MLSLRARSADMVAAVEETCRNPVTIASSRLRKRPVISVTAQRSALHLGVPASSHFPLRVFLTILDVCLSCVTATSMEASSVQEFNASSEELLDSSSRSLCRLGDRFPSSSTNATVNLTSSMRLPSMDSQYSRSNKMIFGFEFGSLNENSKSLHRSCGERENGKEKTLQDVAIVTRQFFPIKVPERIPTLVGAIDTARKPYGITFCLPDAPATLSLQAMQPVKKRRRGPLSKSLQYSGVTFSRRTGRWESHIWDSGKQVYLGKPLKTLPLMQVHFCNFLLLTFIPFLENMSISVIV